MHTKQLFLGRSFPNGFSFGIPWNAYGMERIPPIINNKFHIRWNSLNWWDSWIYFISTFALKIFSKRHTDFSSGIELKIIHYPQGQGSLAAFELKRMENVEWTAPAKIWQYLVWILKNFVFPFALTVNTIIHGFSL